MTAPTPAVVAQISATLLTDPTDAAPDTTNGNSFDNTGRTFIRFHNTAGAPATVTFAPRDAAAGARGELAVTGEQVTIPATSTRWLGRRELDDFGKKVKFTASATTCTFTVFEP
jgi:hypothetical protein